MKKTEPRYSDIDDRTEELRDLTERYPEIWEQFLEGFELSQIYHENALEGIVLTHAELTSALSGRPIAADTYYPIRNLKCGMDLVRREVETRKSPINIEFVRRIHEALGAGERPDFVPGRYRKIVPLHRTYFHEIAQPQAIAPRVAKLMDWAALNDPDDEDAVKFAAHFHFEFMSIFPFQKHTGKTGRLLLNYTLMRHGYMPVIFHATERQRYYDTLRQTPREMEGFLNDMMFNCVDNVKQYVGRVLDEREKRPQLAAV